MKKTILLLTLMALTPLVLAQEVNETDTEVMHTPYGALLRFVQLDRQIELRLIKGNAVIQAMTELSIANTSVLTDILSELETVQDTVKTYEMPSDEVNLTQRIEAFVDLKTDAIELVSDFRNESRILLEGVNMSEFLEKLKSINENTTRIQELNMKVRNYIREYNAERINKTLKNLGINNNSLIEQARNGTLKNELKNQIRINYELHKAQVRQKIIDLREDLARERIQNRQLLENVTAKYLERQKARINNTINVLSRLKDRIQNRINSLGGNS